jgi:thiol-disulfide isomerase/thioredoxin
MSIIGKVMMMIKLYILTSQMVVSCMPSWCGPCKSMDTYFEELSRQFRDIVFVKVSGGPVLKVSN